MSDKDEDTLTVAWKSTMRFSIGNTNWRGIFGTSESPPDEMQPLFDLADEATHGNDPKT